MVDYSLISFMEERLKSTPVAFILTLPRIKYIQDMKVFLNKILWMVLPLLAVLTGRKDAIRLI